MNYLLPVMHFAALGTASSALAAALIAGLWQGIALAFLTSLILKFLPRTTAAARFVVWTVVFATSAAMPILHLVSSANAGGTASSGHLYLDLRWSYLLAILWIGVALFRLVMLVVEAIGLRQLWRTAESIDYETLRRRGVQGAVSERRIEVCTSSEVDRPSVIGFFAPRILIPRWLFSHLSDTELRHIVLHEAEHLRRRDDWFNLMQQIGLVLFPISPAMFWIDRRLSTEREIACDDGVLAQTNTPRAYASTLTSIAGRRLDFRSPRRMVALALGAFGAATLLHRRSEFARRIESILGRRSAGSPALAVVLIAIVCAGAGAMTQAPELVSFGRPSAPSAAAQAASTSTPVSARTEAYPTPAVASFQNVSFGRPSRKHLSRAPHLAKMTARPFATSMKVVRSEGRPSRKSQLQWLVLTSFEQQGKQRTTESTDGNDPRMGDVVIPVSHVVVRAPDGRFFVTPYAAVPTQAGWLIVQL